MFFILLKIFDQRCYKTYNKKMSHRFSFYSKKQSKALLEQLKARQELNFAYLIIDCDRILDEWITKIETESCFIALDTETKGLTPAPGMVKTLQIAYSEDVPVLIIELPKIKYRSSLQRLMTSPKLLKVGHQIKFDILMLAAEGIKVREPVMCTMLGIEVLKAGATRQASLQFTAQDLLNIRLDKAEQSSDWGGKLTTTQLQYAANDAGILLKIMTELQQKLDRAGLTKIAILEYCCLLPIIEMQSRGIY
jgi:DNA polymerase-1